MMNTNLTAILYVALLSVSMLVSIFLVARLLRLWDKPGTPALLLIIASVAIWSLGYALEIMLPNLTAKTSWAEVQYIGISLLPLGAILFMVQFSGRRNWLTPVRIGLVAAIPVVTILVTFTTQFHGLMYSATHLPATIIGPLKIDHGIWFYIFSAYSYILLLLSAYLALMMAIRGAPIYRAQARLMLVALLVPWLSNFLYVSGLELFGGYDLTPVAFTLTNILLEIAFSRFGLIERLPVAHEAVFRAMNDVVIVINEKDYILEVNPAGRNILKSKEEPVGMKVQELFPDWDAWQNESSLSGEIARDIQLGVQTYYLRTAPLQNRRERINGHVVLLTDVTAEQQAQVTMRLQSAALEAAQNGIVIIDREGNIQWANPAYTRLTGFSRAEAIGQKLGLLKSGAYSQEFYQELWDTILAGKVWQGEVVNQRKDGSLYDEEITITPLVQPDGTISSFIAIKQDITQRKETEAALKEARDEAVEANRLKTQLLASVSHDLRTPLGVIMGYSEMLQKGILGDVNDEQENAASEILDSANRLLAFVNNLIGQAQFETGRLVIRPSVFSPVELTDGVKSLVGFMAKKKSLVFESEIDPSFPKQLRADPYWLKQILHNLVNNALKFTEKGSVKVRLFLPDESHWAMQVSDTGIGIPDNARQSLFKAFQQVPGKKSLEGSGLGLSIVQQLTQLMNGKIELQSELGRGSTFTVILPLVTS